LGTINYLAVTTQPNISFATQVLSSFMHALGACYWCTLKHLCCYLKGIMDYGIAYHRKGASLFPISYFDVNYVIELNHHSLSG
ncbi:hypothetical protein HETIRDRAFT_318920, partial [Heterobasidion irregulare TC 32-1]